MSGIDKAKELLDKLQSRTEARGATPAEAEQAAKLAERIAKRYGLNLNTDKVFESTYTTSQNTFPRWGRVLAMAMRERFGVESFVGTQKGQRAKVKFTGPEHLAAVAAWLYKAIELDIKKRSYCAAKAAALSGGELRSFRLEFSLGAVWQVYHRLNPPEPVEELTLTDEDRERIDRYCEKWEAKEKKRLAKLSRAQLKRESRQHLARLKGQKFGKEIPIGTDVVGGREVPRIELFTQGPAREH